MSTNDKMNPLTQRVQYSNLQIRFLRYLWGHAIPIQALGKYNMTRVRGLALRDPSPVIVRDGALMLSPLGVDIVKSFSGSDQAKRAMAGDVTESVANALALVRMRRRKES